MKMILIAGLAALALAGCQTVQPASTAPVVVSTPASTTAPVQTTADRQVAKAGAELEKYCGLLQLASSGATVFAPEKQRAIAEQANAAVRAVCVDPPKDVAGALIAAARAYAAVQAARAVAEPGV